MVTSENALRKEVVGLLAQINIQLTELEDEAQRQGIPPEKLRDRVGQWSMTPLLLAKTQAIATLVQLNRPRERT